MVTLDLGQGPDDKGLVWLFVGIVLAIVIIHSL